MNNRTTQKGLIGMVILVAVLVSAVIAVIVGYLFLQNPKKFLVDDKIASDTSHEESLKDKIAPRTEIKESGLALEVVIKPSDNNVVSDTVDITATKVVEEAVGVVFFISETKEGLTEGGMPVIGRDSSSDDGWSSTFDTTEYDNGKYYINVVVYSEDADGPPLGVAQIPVEIKN